MPLSVTGKRALVVAERAAREAGGILLRMRGAAPLHWKGRSNVVTEADIAAERAVVDVVGREFPGHGVLGEEGGRSGGGADFVWVVDPLDGTNNFLSDLPFFCVTVALTRADEALLGVTYDPIRDELFSAERGGPAFLNGREVRCSDRKTLDTCLIGFDIGYDPVEGRQMLDLVSAMWGKVLSIRLLGSAAMGLAYVAAGRLDVYCHRDPAPWDMAAGIALVRSAGGIAADWSGADVTPHSKGIIAGGRSPHRIFSDWMQSSGNRGRR